MSDGFVTNTSANRPQKAFPSEVFAIQFELVFFLCAAHMWSCEKCKVEHIERSKLLFRQLSKKRKGESFQKVLFAVPRPKLLTKVPTRSKDNNVPVL